MENRSSAPLSFVYFCQSYISETNYAYDSRIHLGLQDLWAYIVTDSQWCGASYAHIEISESCSTIFGWFCHTPRSSQLNEVKIFFFFFFEKVFIFWKGPIQKLYPRKLWGHSITKTKYVPRSNYHTHNVPWKISELAPWLMNHYCQGISRNPMRFKYLLSLKSTEGQFLKDYYILTLLVLFSFFF